MRSDNAKAGMQQAPARSLFRALGLTEEEMARPLIGVVNSYNEIVPGHMNLDKIRGSKTGNRHGRRYPDRVPGYRSLRWNRHGTCGYEIFLSDQRSDR